MALTGGLNFQIEHHLVPRLNSWHYPLVQQVVREACARHGVHYTYYPTLVDNMLSTVRYMRQAGSGGGAIMGGDVKQPVHLLISGKRLDVTHWASKHPGGAEIFSLFENRDATDQVMHSSPAVRLQHGR
jgi:hypothetical protein